MDESNDSSVYSEYYQAPVKITKGLNTGKWMSILSILKNGNNTEQVVSLTELSNLLSYSNEDYLLGFPSMAYIKVLFHILENPDVKYSKLYPQNYEKGSESQDGNLSLQLPYYHFLSSVYKDEKLLMDKVFTEQNYDDDDKELPEDNKENYSDSGMDLDEEEYFEPDSAVLMNKMILSATCLNTILDIVPYTSRYFAMNDNLTILCNKLSDIEYIDLAERILLIFEKLSSEIPLSLLKKSVLYQMLQYIDFFPTDIQISSFNSVLNVVRLVDNKDYFIQYIIPILNTLSAFIENDNKKLVDVVITIWKEILSIVIREDDEELVSEFVSKLSENNFLEKILQLILSPNMGRNAILEHVSILSSLVLMSTEMVKQLFNQSDSVQYAFLHLANNILSNTAINYEEEDESDEESHLDEPDNPEQPELNDTMDVDLTVSETEDKSKDLVKEDRDAFFIENPQYFSTIFELLPLTDLCNLYYLLSSDRHKASVIGLIHNILRISNKIEKFSKIVHSTLSVSKTTELVSTCLLQVDLNSEETLNNLLGILEVLINMYGNNVIVTFQRYGINEYLTKLGLNKPNTSSSSVKLRHINELVELIVSNQSNQEQNTQHSYKLDPSQEDSDLLFEIRTNFDVWTPYELVNNVPITRLNFFQNQDTLHKFIKTLVSQSFTTTHLNILWKAFLKIFQSPNLYNSSCSPINQTTPTSSSSNNFNDNVTNTSSLKTPPLDSEQVVLKIDENSVSKENNTSKPDHSYDSTHNKPKKSDVVVKSSKTEYFSKNNEGIHILGNFDKRYKTGLEGVLKRYVNSYSSHPFNILHSELKLRLRPMFLSNKSPVSPTNTPESSKKQDKLAEKMDNDQQNASDKDADRLLPISVYVPCLVRMSRVENYIKRYVEKKINSKVLDVLIYLNGVCLGSNVTIYEALCRFGGFNPKKRRHILSHTHMLKYKYTLNPEQSTSMESQNSAESSEETKFEGNLNVSGAKSPEQGLKIYTLYKGSKYNFNSLLEDLSQFLSKDNENTDTSLDRVNKFDETEEELKLNEQEYIHKDDSTIATTGRCDECSNANTELDTNYLDSNKLMDIYERNNKMDDLYTKATTEYLNSLCNQKVVENKNDSMDESIMNENNEGYNFDLSNPIIYTKLPSETVLDEAKSDHLKYLMKLAEYDHERISLIMGEDSNFSDFLLECAFPIFPAKFPYDKKILLRILSIFENLIHKLNPESEMGDMVSDNSQVESINNDKTELNELSNGTQEDQRGMKLVVSSPLSLKLLSACSDLSRSLCFGCEYWVQSALSCPSIFSLRSRTILFRMNTVGLHRNLSHFHNKLKNLSNDGVTEPFDDYLFEYVANNKVRFIDEEVKIPKLKILVDRENLLEDAMTTFENVQNNPKLEIEYKNEVGIGSGPTLEFFTLISEAFAEFQTPRLLECVSGYHFPSPHSIDSLNMDSLAKFLSKPQESEPLVSDTCMSTDSQNDDLPLLLFKLFSFLGKVCAYVMLDDKMFDLFFHPLFWDLVKYPNKPQNLTLETLAKVDPDLAKSLEQIREHPDPIQLHLVHEYKGYELFKGGSNVYVNKENVEEYVQLIVDFKLLHGIKLQIWAFRYGFSCVLPLYSLWFFTDSELSEVIFGNKKNQSRFWTMEHLKNYIVPDHGYDTNSKVYNDLITILHNFNDEEKRLFLKFTTGSPLLPREGFKSLVPLMRVVKKGNADELPSVMTCTNYLKMPEYTSIEEMKNKLIKAIEEGQNAFNLS
ncbi:ubiquitin-related protein, putative [Theileria annulata]|uniref:HECT-type E3 ubiquitin transferase n=1 Tax=Theileria annulata TaxID=5874 RepID=Q4UG38_THEAN|nr:ubiquitin-related protein, putative [Theileria annulata]CAI73951.1 ubiquitin-related protein, putative [Theileria annulata]|eukprot:XP_954628.1 ubiquitin-related protein, putative [Theileria annulata]